MLQFGSLVPLLQTFAAIAYVVRGWGSSSSESGGAPQAVSQVPDNFYVLGINPRMSTYFYDSKTKGKFSCLDNSATVLWDSVNDNYCDCADGSDEPGTSACPTSTFFCRNDGGSKWSEESFPSSHISDGVCDCCDGSDEPGRTPSCPNLCNKKALQNRLGIKKLAKKHSRGYKSRKSKGSLKSLKKQFLDFKEKQFSKMGEEESSAIAEMNRMQGYFQKASQSGSAIDPRAYQYASQLQHSLRGIAFHRQMLEKLQSKHLGSRMEFFPMLISKCIRSDYINEKRFKGGTPNVVPQIYQIELCPFRTITLLEINHTVWEQKEDHVKHGGSLATFSVKSNDEKDSVSSVEVSADGSNGPVESTGDGNGIIKRNKFGDEESGKTLLGIWHGWQVGRKKTFSTMLFRNGEKCADGIGTKGHHRLADVNIRCGTEERLIEALENVCHYSMTFETPSACSLKESKKLKESL